MGFQQIGVLGGGQLGLMLQRHGSTFDHKFIFLDSDSDCSVARLFPGLFRNGNFRDVDSVKMFSDECDLLTVEIEDVSVAGLKKAEKMGVKVFPQSKNLELIQDKGLQKQMLVKLGIETGDFQLKEDLTAMLEEDLPRFIKSRRSGYDGQGVFFLDSLSKVDKLFPGPYVSEKPVSVKKELAIQIVRNESGKYQLFPPVEMVFDARRNILDALLAPARDLTLIQIEQMQKSAIKIAEELNYVGILAIEYFLTKEDQLLVNELSPRPHNSGHHTLHWSSRNQFEMHIRAICNMPLPPIQSSGCALMINLLGEQDANGEPDYSPLSDVLSIPNVYVELYAKGEVRPFRKMGHVTIVGYSREELLKQREELRPYLVVRAKG
jgi:5-(carboxyamino)imidazole ribonucleotide synthase